MRIKLRSFISFGHTFLAIFVFLNISLFSGQLLAQYFLGPVSSGFGGAGVGGIESSESVFLNPAAISHGATLEMGMFYEDAQKFLGEDFVSYGLSVIDNSKSVLFSGGVGYLSRHRYVPAAPDIDETYLQMGISYGLKPNLSVGLSISNLEQQSIIEEITQLQFGVGAHYIYSPTLFLGVTLENLNTFQDTDLSDSERLPRATSIGADWRANEFLRLRSDIRYLYDNNPDKKMIYAMGLESRMGDYFLIKFGYNKNDPQNVDYNVWSVGFKGPRLNMTYSYKKGVKGEYGGMHSVDFRVPLW
ncbi:MAG: hypothetical protein HOO06_14335 [Bdellovibrionaceae bacterium]|jgi:hypothetical protein|nr:hypothetical protein [Pseudobdellovibrionaceae bacterium]